MLPQGIYKELPSTDMLRNVLKGFGGSLISAKRILANLWNPESVKEAHTRRPITKRPNLKTTYHEKTTHEMNKTQNSPRYSTTQAQHDPRQITIQGTKQPKAQNDPQHRMSHSIKLSMCTWIDSKYLHIVGYGSSKNHTLENPNIHICTVRYSLTWSSNIKKTVQERDWSLGRNFLNSWIYSNAGKSCLGKRIIAGVGQNIPEEIVRNPVWISGKCANWL